MEIEEQPKFCMKIVRKLYGLYFCIFYCILGLYFLLIFIVFYLEKLYLLVATYNKYCIFVSIVKGILCLTIQNTILYCFCTKNCTSYNFNVQRAPLFLLKGSWKFFEKKISIFLVKKNRKKGN